VAGGDVVKDQLVGALVLVALGAARRVAGVDVVERTSPLDHAAAVNVEAGDDALGEHADADRD
jgi:hypothetical protein